MSAAAAATAAATAATIASANSINASSRAGKVARCREMVKGYQHDTATVEQQQDYAYCIGKLHPQDSWNALAIALVTLVVILGATFILIRLTKL